MPPDVSRQSAGRPHFCDGSGNLFLADSYNHRIREVVQATGNIITVAGTGATTDSGDGGPATAAGLASLQAVAVDASGNLFLADASGNRVREVVQATGNIVTVAGTGTAGYSGDNGPATAAMLNQPCGVAVDGSGNLFISDTNNNRVREVVQATGNIITFAGTGVSGYSGDGGLATAARLYSPRGLAVDSLGDLLIADLNNARIREVVQSSGAIVTLAGTGSFGYSGDGGPATSAALGSPYGVAVDGSGNLFIADSSNNAVREVLANPSPVLGPLSATAWTVNQPSFSAMIPILNAAPPQGAFVTATGLPAGLSVALSGTTVTVTGTPTAAGSYGSVTITLRGVSGSPLTSRTYSMTINAAPGLGTLGFPAGWTVGRSGYNGGISTSGGTGALTLRSQANLPPGLTAVLSAGVITFTGTPTTVGTYNNVQLTVQDTIGATASGTYTITINPLPTLAAPSITTWTVNQTGLSSVVSVLGGTAPMGNLSYSGMPPGLYATQSGNTILIKGTPTTTGTYSNVQLSIQDYTFATASATFSITINPAPTLGALSSTAWTVNQPGFSSTVNVSGGTTPIGNLSATGLPPGMSATLSGNTISISGTPTTAGTYNNIQLAIQDSALATASRTFSITINPAPTLGSLSTTAWSVNQPGFNGTMTISGGLAPYRNLSVTGLPPGLTAALAGNTITVSGTPTATGQYFINASVRDSAGAVASAGSMLTVAGPAVLFYLTNNPTAMTAGTSGSVTVTALDSSGYVATAYQGTISLSSSDPAAVLPASYTFTAADAGAHTFTFTLKTTGSQQLFVSDPTGIYGYSAPITVSPAALDHFTVAAPPYPASYYAFNVTVTAKDAYNNTIPGYTGTVHFTSSDGAVTLPADYTFAPADQGSHTFSATLQTTGTQTITVNDRNNVTATGTASVQDLNYIPGLHFVITPSVTTATAGAPFDVTLTALDQYNNVAVHYVGTVNFSSTDHGAGVVLPADYTFTAADAGVHTFGGGVTLVTAGNQSLSAVDTSTVVTGGYGLSSASIAVVPAPASTFTITGLPATVTRGVAQTFTVTSKDPYGNTVTSYSGPVHFSSSDLQAILPPDTALTGGTGTFQVVFVSLGTQALTVADASNSAVSATQGGITVNPAPAVRLAVTGFPSSTSAGVTGTFTVAAIDANGYVAAGYTGTVHFTSSDPLAVLPGNVTLTNGTGSFSAILKTAGTQSLTATDTANTSLNGTESGITVTPAAASTLILAGFPTTITAGVAGTATVTARDAYGNLATGYTGTVHFTSSDPQAILPADYTFTAADAGVHTFSATLFTTGSQTLGVQDGQNNLTGTPSAVNVVPAGASSLVATAYQSVTTAGAVDNVTIAAQDPYGNVATGYRGTVDFTSSDSQAGLPGDYAFTAADAGIHTFAVVLKTAGVQTVSFQDAQAGSGSSLSISVAAAAASQFVLTGFPSATTAGAIQSLTLTARDAYGNVATGYTGTVHFSSSDPQAALPADYSFSGSDNGVHTFAASLGTAGTQSLTATDTATPALTASQAGISVVAGAVGKLTVSGYPATTAGTSHSFTVTATDAYGNLATGYTGTVHFTSSDPLAVLPADVALTNGTGTFSATLKTAGGQSLTATDTANASLQGTEGSITVAPAAATTLILAGFPTTITAGVSGTATVTARDAYGNVATGYTGTVHFTGSDPQAVLPADYTFTAADAGTHTFTITFKTAATQSLTAADTTGTLSNGSQSGIAVNAAAVARLTGSAPASSIPNSGYPFFVWAVDAYGNQVRTYTGTVHFSSSDPQAVLPADYTYTSADAGSHNFVATFKTVGNQTITVTDTGTAGVGAIQFNVNVQVGAAAGLALTGFPSPTTAGVASTFTVRAYDLYGNTATGYTGTVHFTSSDAAALLPADYTFTAADAGVHTFSATLITAGGQGLWVQDAQNNLTAAQYAISVAPAAASKLVATAYNAFTTAGAIDYVTIAAQDTYGNVATSYTGTVHVSSSDSQATLPADYTFTAGDSGVHTFAIPLKTAGPQTVTFQDTHLGFSSTLRITVTAGAASQLVISGFPSATTAGFTQGLSLTAKDAYGNVATGYTGTVHFTSSDLQAVLPADYTFSTSDNGVHTFSASLCTASTQSLTATDTVTSTLTASQTGISVVAGAVSRFIVSGYPATTAGTSHSFSVTAIDAYGNVATGYRGTVHFTSSDSQAVLPSNYTFTAADNGVHTFSATLKTAGSQSLTVTDTATSSITGSQSGISVTAAAATHFVITAPANVSIGVAFSVTVTALDAYGNIATGYLGTIHFTSSDNKAILPSNYTFLAADAGVHTFTVIFKSRGTQTLTATDALTGSIKGSASVKVS